LNETDPKILKEVEEKGEGEREKERIRRERLNIHCE
jgi:hypothetical protein